MRYGLALAALLLPLSGCYVTPVGQAGYGYAQPTDPYGNIYPGYAYNDGAPTLMVDGAVMPLTFFDGGWGYYDGRHGWHRAPDSVGHHLEQQRAGGENFHGGGGYQQGRPGGAQYQQQGIHPTAGGQPQYRGQPGGQSQGIRPISGAQPQSRPAQQPAHEEHRRSCEPGQRC